MPGARAEGGDTAGDGVPVGESVGLGDALGTPALERLLAAFLELGQALFAVHGLAPIMLEWHKSQRSVGMRHRRVKKDPPEACDFRLGRRGLGADNGVVIQAVMR